MKKISKIVLASLLLFSCSKSTAKAVTEFSSYAPPTNSGTYYTQLTNPANAYEQPDTVYALYDFTAGGQSYFHTFTDFVALPDGVVPSSVQVRATLTRTNSTGVVDISVFGAVADGAYNASALGDSPYLCSGSAQQLDYIRMANNTSAQVLEFYWSDEDPTAHCVSDYFTAHTFDPANFYIILNAALGSTNQDVRVNNIEVRISYDAVASVTNFSGEASPSAQLVYLDMDGYAGYYGEDVTCRLNVFEKCVRDGYANIESDTPIAHIELDPLNELDYTQNNGGGYYTAYGYSETTSHWYADNIEAPYYPGYTCHYPVQTLCVYQEYTCNGDVPPICTWGTASTVVDSMEEGLDREVVHSSLFTEPEPDNPLAWIVWKAKQVLIDFFTYNTGDTREVVLDFKQQLESKAPFGYFITLFELDFSDTTTTTTMPAIVFAFDGFEDFTFTPPKMLTDLFTLIRTTSTIFIWLLFVGYLFMLPRRMI